MDAGPQIRFAPAPMALAISAGWRRGIALTLWALISLAALLLAARLAAGALEIGLSAGGLIASGLVLLVASAAIRSIWPADEPARIKPQWVQWAVAAPVVLAALALTIPCNSPVDAIALWLLLAIGESWSIRSFQASWKYLPPRNPRAAVPPTAPPTEPSAREPLAPESVHTTNASIVNDDAPALAEGVVQQFTRVCSPTGEDLIQGLMRARFAAGERTTMLHIAFCPPFATTPQLHIEQLDGPQARIKPGPIQPFGARLEVRLNQPASTPTDVLIEFVAEQLTMHS